jgi:hypothetical protein
MLPWHMPRKHGTLRLRLRRPRAPRRGDSLRQRLGSHGCALRLPGGFVSPPEEGGLEEFEELVDFHATASSSFSTRFFYCSTAVLKSKRTATEVSLQDSYMAMASYPQVFTLIRRRARTHVRPYPLTRYAHP